MKLNNSISPTLSAQMRRLYLLNQKSRRDFNFIHINKCGGTSIIHGIGQKYKLHDIALERRIYLGSKWEKAFNFSVVRNPYSRIVSLYNYQIKNNYIKQNGQLSLYNWINEFFVQDTGHHSKKWRMYLKQKSWIYFEEKLLVDNFYKLENIYNDWNEIISQCKQPYRPLRKLNATDRDEINLTGAEIRLINKVFKYDFETFEYRMEK